MTHYYIYYRISPDFANEAKRAIRECQAYLFNKTGIQGRLLIKYNDPHLWMEIYEQVMDRSSFEQALSVAVTRFNLEKWLKPGGFRQLEQFQDS